MSGRLQSLNLSLLETNRTGNEIRFIVELQYYKSS